MTTMTIEHPKWQEFVERLEGSEGCDFQVVKEDGEEIDYRWTCAGGTDKSIAQKILSDMGFTWEEIEESCAYFESHGGYCDCEILFNVNR